MIDCPFGELNLTRSTLGINVFDFLSEDECDYLNDVYDSREELQAEIAATNEYTTGSRGVVNKDYRDLKWTWVPLHDHFDFYQRHWERVQDINRREFQFDISGIQDCLLLRYRDNEFFKEHYDAFHTSPANEVRKITMVTLLNDPREFEGGLDLFYGEEPERMELIKRGQTIMFPPTTLHRVEKIIGERRVLVTWAVGDRWK